MVNPYKVLGDSYARNRQFLMSFDIDLNKVKTKNELINSIIHTFGFKNTAPSLEFRKNNFLFSSNILLMKFILGDNVIFKLNNLKGEIISINS